MNENLDSATEKKAKNAEYRDEILAKVNELTGIDLKADLDKAVAQATDSPSPKADALVAYLKDTINSILDNRTTLIHGTIAYKQVHFRINEAFVRFDIKKNAFVPYVKLDNVKKCYSISDPNNKPVYRTNCPEGYFQTGYLPFRVSEQIDKINSVLKEDVAFVKVPEAIEATYKDENGYPIKKKEDIFLYLNREGNVINYAKKDKIDHIIDELKTFSIVSGENGLKKDYHSRIGEGTDKKTGEVIQKTQHRLFLSISKEGEPIYAWFSGQSLQDLSDGKKARPDEIENGAIDICPMKLNLDTGYLENADSDLTKRLNDDLREGYHECIDTYGLKGANRMIFRMKAFYPSLDILKAKDMGEKETQAAEKTESVEKKEKPSVKKSPAAKKPAEKAEKVVSGPRIK